MYLIWRVKKTVWCVSPVNIRFTWTAHLLFIVYWNSLALNFSRPPTGGKYRLAMNHVNKTPTLMSHWWNFIVRFAEIAFNFISRHDSWKMVILINCSTLNALFATSVYISSVDLCLDSEWSSQTGERCPDLFGDKMFRNVNLWILNWCNLAELFENIHIWIKLAEISQNSRSLGHTNC